LPRLRAVEGVCEHCERPLAAHEGPPAPRRYEYPVHQIARTLMEVGRGRSYRRAGLEARRDRGRVRGRSRPGSTEASLAAGWVEVFAPVVFDELDGHDRWPRVLTLDALPVILRTGGKGGGLGFNVLGAGGYQTRGEHELWRLQATPTSTQADWTAFLHSLPGQPEWVVCDRDRGLLHALRAVWPTQTPTAWLCEWHLAHRLEKNLKKAQVPTTNGLWQLLEDAFNDTAVWDAYRAALRAYGSSVLTTWLDERQVGALAGRTREEQISWQITNRQLARNAGVPRTSGALESELNRLRGEVFKGRQHAYRNQARTNRMLMLWQLERNGAALERRYARVITDRLTAGGGIPERRRVINDRHGQHTLR
jgi:hypothetical protein